MQDITFLEAAQKYNLDIRNKFANSWKEISCFIKLPEDYMREYQDKLDWNYISKYQKLSEEFIEEFKDKLNNQ